MLNIARLIILIFMLVFAPVGAEAGGTDVRYSEGRPLVYEDSWNLRPFAFINKDGQPDGLHVEVVKTILDRLQIPYKINLRPSADVRRDMTGGKADVTIGMRKEYNAQYGLFGKVPVITFHGGILAPTRDSLTRVTQEQLYNLRFFVHKGSASQRFLSRRGYDYAMSQAEDMDQVAMDLAMADSGIVVWNAVLLSYLKRKYNLNDFSVGTVDVPMGETSFITNDEKLLARLDSALEAMRRNHELDAIFNKWLYPEKVEKTVPLVWLIARYVIVCFVIVIVAAVVIVHFKRRKMRLRLRDAILQLALVNHANKIKVWIYSPVTGKYSWMDKHGDTGQQYSTFEFSLFYSKDEFEKINQKVAAMLRGDASSIMMQVKGYCLSDINKQLDIELSMRTMRDGYKHIKCIVGIQRDITEGKAKLRSKRVKAFLGNTLFDAGVTCLYRFDADGNLTSINPAACTLMGVESQEEALQKGINIHHLTLFSEAQLASTEKVKLTGSIALSDRPDGFALVDEGRRQTEAVFHYKASMERIIDKAGNTLGFIVSLSDKSDLMGKRELAQKLADDSEKLLKEINVQSAYLDYTLDIGGTRMGKYDPKTKIVSTTRMDKKAPLALPQLQMLSECSSDTLPELFRIFAFMDSYTDGNASANYRTTTHYSNGCYRNIHMEMQPVHDKDGKVCLYVGIHTDITDLVESQQKLSEETALAKETDNLKQSFINNMSYRVRNPLVGMAKSIELMAQTDDRSVEQGQLSKVSDNVSRLLYLMDDTLFLSRIDAGMTKEYPVDVDFCQLLSDTFHETVDKYRSEKVEYSVETSEKSLMLHIDAELIRRVIAETVALFARFVSSGYLRVRYMYRRDTISLVVETGDYIIPQTSLKQVFQPRLVDNLMSTSDNTSGLEMAIVKSILTLLHGTIDLDSKPGHGTSALIIFPVKAV